MPMEALIRKLRATTSLDQDDIAAIQALPAHIKDVAPGTTIVREGDQPDQCCLLIDGFAVRVKTTDEGKRQILSIHIAGDIPDLQSLHLHVMDHDVKTLSACKVGFISHEALKHLTRSRPLVAEALWRDTLIDAAIFREWIVNLGRRSASQRVAHLVLEMKERLAAIGRSANGSFRLPMTQGDLADALGLTPVHINRVLQGLRAEGLLEFRRSEVSVGDLGKLALRGDFDDIYLHQRPEL
jgi:CRP-like cAMP-binding protein